MSITFPVSQRDKSEENPDLFANSLAMSVTWLVSQSSIWPHFLTAFVSSSNHSFTAIRIVWSVNGNVKCNDMAEIHVVDNVPSCKKYSFFGITTPNYK
jgi:hypothetical protein